MRSWLRDLHAVHAVHACALALATCVCVGGCTEDVPATDEGTDDGSATPRSLFVIDFDGATVCGDPVDRVEFATRRVDCWDPELPCTVSADPPWITGTTAACSEIAGSMNWEVEVTQTGKYETQVRALAGSSQEGVHCFSAGGGANTRVANEDLDTQAQFMLTEIAATECSNP